MFDVDSLHWRLVVTFFASEDLSNTMRLVEMKLQVFFAITFFRTNLTEESLLLAMSLLGVSLELRRGGEHHGTVDTGVLVEFGALPQVCTGNICDHSELQLCHHGVRVDLLDGLYVNSSDWRTNTDNLTRVID